VNRSPVRPSHRDVAILVIDDDDDIRDTLSEVLQEIGYTVATASQGAEALELLRHVRPQVILLDLNMPVMSGVQFREVQRGDPVLSKIPTIVMTAVDRMPDRLSDLAAAEILAKPFRLPDLVALIKPYLQDGTGRS
jgi:CheY-like chemotaxis protein